MITVALSFDDGPSEWTDALLDILAAHDARATFFILGEHAKDHHDLIARTAAEGHEIGVHGWNHARTRNMHQRTLYQRLTRTKTLVKSITGTEPTLWRPPWHDADRAALRVVRQAGLRRVGVDVDVCDTNADTDTIVSRTLAGITANAIVGLHDGMAPNGNIEQLTRQPTLDAVEHLLANWVRSVTVSEALRL